MKASVSTAVIEALTDRFGTIEVIGAGAWSTAFKFYRGGEPLVVRVGEHVADFRVDAEMAAYSSPNLPIPAVYDLSRLDPPLDHLHLCVSTRASGTPLELSTSEEWRQLVPQVADILDAMHAIRPPAGTAVTTWPDLLLAKPDGDGRLRGWGERLRARPDQLAAHRAVMGSLRSLCERPHVATVSPTLLHCDLINRNVHVDGGRITGVFDWGCRRWGDHLYDLAWFEFWAPWYPDLDFSLLRSELTRRWDRAPDPDRMSACLLHIGADHLVYNAAVGDCEDGRKLIDRLVALDLIS